MEITLGLAFLAGLASFLSPCVLSLVPVYMSYLAGRSVSRGLSEDNSSLTHSLLHGASFVLGFSIVFISLGLAFSVIGNLLYEARGLLEKIGGIIVILFGLHLAGILRIGFLEYDLRPKTEFDRKRGFLSSFLMGVFFSAGWSPCVGPVLGTILVIALNQGNVTNGAILLACYSAGMAIPFLIASGFVGWFTRIIMKHRKALRVIEICMGIVMVLVGILLFLGIFERLSSFGTFIDLGI